MEKSYKTSTTNKTFAKKLAKFKNKFSRKIFLSLSLLFTCSVLTSFSIFEYFETKTLASNSKTEFNSQILPSPTPDPLAPYNILLLGYGGLGHDGGEITDTIMVLHIRPRDKHLITISIPRDLWVPLELDESIPVYKKINHAYALGNDLEQYKTRPKKYQTQNSGLLLAKDSIELITGLPIKHTMTVNFAVFEEAIDALGGVTVDVPSSFVDEYFPIKGEEDNPCDKSEEEIASLTATMSGYLLEQQFKCRYETLEFNQGEVLMDGQTALKFVRSRHSNTSGNDFNRAMRQQALIKSLKKKATSLEGILKSVSTLKVIFKNINTDLDFESLTNIITTHSGIKDYQIDSVIVSTDNVLAESRSLDRQYILVPKSGETDWQSINDYVETSIASASANKLK